MLDHLIPQFMWLRAKLRKHDKNIVHNIKNLKTIPLVKGKTLMDLVLTEPNDIPMTPFLKNALIQSKELAPGSKKLSLDTPITKAEIKIIETTKLIIDELFGKVAVDKELKINPDLQYDRSKALDDPHHYLIDVLRNWRKMGREITPGSYNRRMKQLDMYHVRTGKLNYMDLLKHDMLFRTAITFVMDLIPPVVSVQDMNVTAQPFMSKHTNVGYPYFMNDKTLNKEGVKYADVALADAKSTPMTESLTYPAAILGRDQRSGWEKHGQKYIFKDSKARVVFGVSRIPNLQLSRIQNPETEALKRSPAFWGFLGSDKASPKRKHNQNILLRMGLVEENYDIEKMDTSVTEQDQLLRGAIAWVKTKDAPGKRLVEDRTIMGCRTTYIEPGSTHVSILKGAQASGRGDTNSGDGIIMLPIIVYAMMLQDKDWIKNAIKILNQGGSPIEVMGDDIRVMHKKNINQTKFISDVAKFNKIIHPSKGEYGTFFVQERTFRLKNQGQVMVVPFPRIISKTFWTERPKGLGPFGWTVATYMKLAPLKEWKELLYAVIRMICLYDKFRLGTLDEKGKEINFAKFMLEYKKEDLTAIAKGKQKTADKLYDGDPNKEGTIFVEGDFSRNFLKSMFDAVKAAFSGR